MRIVMKSVSGEKPPQSKEALRDRVASAVSSHRPEPSLKARKCLARNGGYKKAPWRVLFAML